MFSTRSMKLLCASAAMAIAPMSMISSPLTANAAEAHEDIASKTATHDAKASTPSDARFELSKTGENSAVLKLEGATLDKSQGQAQIVDNEGTVLETLPLESKIDGVVTSYNYEVNEQGEIEVTSHTLKEGDLSRFNERGWIRCTIGTLGGAIVGGVGGAGAGGAAGSVLPGAGTVIGAIGYGAVSAIGGGAAGAAGAC